jgi:hypothetical protein
MHVLWARHSGAPPGCLLLHFWQTKYLQHCLVLLLGALRAMVNCPSAGPLLATIGGITFWVEATLKWMQSGGGEGGLSLAAASASGACWMILVVMWLGALAVARYLEVVKSCCSMTCSLASRQVCLACRVARAFVVTQNLCISAASPGLVICPTALSMSCLPGYVGWNMLR